MMKEINEGFFPEDLKKMDLRELKLLCQKIRRQLISCVSETGGHLASNLGVVELTVALHYVFDTPRDRIVWDVGHQSYVHKMLTGRGGEFHTLRRLDGLSGFPKRNESIYDTFDTGHSSTSIAAALGMAAARDFQQEDYAVAAVIGDGALTGGMAYEALNNAGVMDTGMIVILNDNAMSISKDHSGMSQHLGRLRTSEKYSRFKHGLKHTLRQIPGVGDAICSGLENVRDAVKYMVVPGVLFEELGFTYLGPVDGHNLQELIEVLQQAKSMKKPVLVHCLTKKGKGYVPAEQHPDQFHGVGPFDPETGKTKAEKRGRTWSEVFGSKLVSMAAEDERILAVSAAMVDGTGLADFARAYPDRVFDVGIAEEHAVTFAAGLAASGMRPVVAIYSTFLQRAYDQIVIDVCMQKLPVLFCLDRAGVVGADGETHHGVFDLSYLNHIPGLTLLAPADAGELEEMMEYAMTLDTPCAIRYPRGTAPVIPSLKKPWKPVPQILHEGTDITIISTGKMTENCLAAARLLEQAEEPLRCQVIHLGILKPLSEESAAMLREEAAKTGCVLTAEDNVVAGGAGSIIAALLADRKDIAVHMAGWPDTFISQGTQSELAHRYGLDPEGIAERVRKIIEGKA